MLHVKYLQRCPSTFTPPHQRSTCRLEKVFKAASRVKSLKPHCVSLIPLTQKNHTRKWNPYIRNVRNRDRCHKKKQKNGNAFSWTLTVTLQYLEKQCYLSHCFFFQVSSGSTGDRHVILHGHMRKTFPLMARKGLSDNRISWLSFTHI